ncbi:MAG TPA: peptidoglycan editing factor PgeF [Candidatus Caenarcaniphilales bacterium]
MHTWHWHSWQAKPFLTCSLLEPWRHGFFTQKFWPQSPVDLTEVLDPRAEVFQVQQVHGNQVLRASEVRIATEGSYHRDLALPLPQADGLLTEQPNQAVWVCSADCTPALIADVQTGQVAAVHAGWRGTAARILPQAIARLQAQGSQLSDLRVAMGPAIAGKVYQVSSEVAVQVGATALKSQLDAMNEPHPVVSLLEALYQLPNPPVVADEKPGHARLDVRKVNALQLTQLGLQPEQIAIAPYCTYQNPEHFFSYRRDNRKQVQWSGIVSQG